jgi:peptidoglycan/LPS O-acetylase OafA/YrhL
VANASEGGRKAYLDGLRGVAALVVLICHVLLVLAPDLLAINGKTGWAVYLTAVGKSPLALFWNGNSAVCVFFVLSGYVMTDFAQRTALSFPAQAIRRYLRLAIPILITSSFAWLLLRMGLLRNAVEPDVVGSWMAGWYSFAPSFSAMTYEALAGTFLTGSNAYNLNLWTMHPELAGSLYVLLFCAVARNRGERTLLNGILMVVHVTDYLPLFAVGALFHDYEAELSRIGSRFAIVLFIAGAYACSMPTFGTEIPLPWHALLPRILIDDVRYWHAIGASLIVLGVLHSASLQEMFASRVGRFLGRISFTLYLIHIPLLASFTAALMLAMNDMGRLPTLLVAGPATVALVLAASWLTSDAIDDFGLRVSRAAGRLWMRLFTENEPEATESKALGLDLPSGLLACADEVIE